MAKSTTSRNICCRGFCIKYENRRTFRKSYYSEWENARCSICGIYIKWEGIHCPCCGFKLRRRPRGADGHKKIMTLKGIKRID